MAVNSGTAAVSNETDQASNILNLIKLAVDIGVAIEPAILPLFIHKDSSGQTQLTQFNQADADLKAKIQQIIDNAKT